MRWYHLILALLIGLAFTLETNAGGGGGGGRGGRFAAAVVVEPPTKADGTFKVTVTPRKAKDATEEPKAVTYTIQLVTGDKATKITTGGGFGPNAEEPTAADHKALVKGARIIITPTPKGDGTETITATGVRVLPPRKPKTE
jgi:hypothetical protein